MCVGWKIKGGGGYYLKEKIIISIFDKIFIIFFRILSELELQEESALNSYSNEYI